MGAAARLRCPGRAPLALAVSLAAVLALGGCAAPPPFYAAAASESLADVYGKEASSGASTGASPGASSAPAQAPAAPAPSPSEPVFVRHPLPGVGGATLQALVRDARTAPRRYRVIVIPGSGCAGMGSIADRYFAGLLHAQVLVLHKPGVDPQARTAPGDCGRDFVQQDRLSTWLAHARAALQADARERAQAGAPELPQLLVGISEGAELLPALAPEVPQLAGLVVLSSSGLDPQEAGALQAQRLEAQADWQALGEAQAGGRADSAVLQGRSLGYWRDLWNWPLTLPLVQSPWPLLQVWGSDDALVPAAAYERFARLAAVRAVPYCGRRLDGADHGLQRRAEGMDAVQLVWSWVEQWARTPSGGLCGPLLLQP
ncbi:MAG: alpha/beta hydrolase [Acidovorax sp.]|uniref:alpha/beta hydrolase n=1 Tax=Acidovorax sp. TaxID=1872122 RepID=UPI0025C184BB|nr:alpha/beta hydrolase [Acidovorax sp.]MCE1191933.1 alpha/beta hydrolase [Acidovorax sp.]